MKLIRKICYDTWREQRLRLQHSSTKSNITPISSPTYPIQPLLSLGKLALRPKPILHLMRVASSPIQVSRYVLAYEDLAEDLDGFTILHLSDLHIDCNPGIMDVLIKSLPRELFHLGVLTGDYQDNYSLCPSQIESPLKALGNAIQTRHGILATLGNHDNVESKRILENCGFHVLVNETAEIIQGKARLFLTGLDDVHRFFTQEALQALTRRHPQDFSLVAVHSPEIFQQAAAAGHNLYLCGHTHGGQVCLPGGIPIVSHSTAPKFTDRGLWQQDGMIGHTSTGVGTSTLPIRLFCPAEISVLTLKRAN